MNTRTLNKLIVALIISLFLVACGDNSESVNGEGENSKSSDAVAKYTCPMHPHYISTDPDGSCPICGMDLVPVIEENSSDSNEPEVQTQVSVSSGMIQTMGVRTEPVEIVQLGRNLRAFGTVEADERLENVSVSRFEGWIEGLKVSAEGDPVKRGDLLYAIYSPDLIAVQKDYLNALNSRNKNRISVVKQRLLSSGMQNKAIQELEGRKTVINKVPVYAETDGVVAELSIRDGGYTKAGTAILSLQSYERVWVIASIPETDLPLLDSGIEAKLRFPSAPNAPERGTVDYVYPTVDPKTRTGRVRIEVNNESGQLLPGAYADITMEFGKKDRLSISTEAILQDSRGSHVIVALGEGRFASRSVSTGINASGRTEIIEGLSDGELVVTSGQFMLDSEVNLREGLSKLSASTKSSAKSSTMNSNESTTADAHSKHTLTPLSEIKPDSSTLAQIDHFVDMALYFHESLVNDDAIDPAFLQPAIDLSDSLLSRFNGTELAPIVSEAQAILRNTQTSDGHEALARQLSELTQVIQPWITEGAAQHYQNQGLALYRDLETGRVWVQKKGDIGNPYGNGVAEPIVLPMSVDDHAEHQQGSDQ